MSSNSVLGKLGSSFSNLRENVERVAGGLKDKMALNTMIFVMENGKRYRPKTILGEGGYATVYLVEDMDNGQEYALKRMLLSQEKLYVAQAEIKVMVCSLPLSLSSFLLLFAHAITEPTSST
jgi:serine/threonine protein kinase